MTAEATAALQIGASVTAVLDDIRRSFVDCRLAVASGAKQWANALGPAAFGPPEERSEPHSALPHRREGGSGCVTSNLLLSSANTRRA